MMGDGFGKFIAILVIVCAVALLIGIFAAGATATGGQYWAVTLIFALAAAIIFFVVYPKSSTASLEGVIQSGDGNTSWRMTGAAACFLITLAAIYNIQPPPDLISFNFVLRQGGAIYKEDCDIDFQIGSATRQPAQVRNGSTTIGGVPGGTRGINVYDISSFKKSYVPVGKAGPPPWWFDIDGSKNVLIELPPKPPEKTFNPPTADELREKLIKSNKFESMKKEYDKAQANKGKREEKRQRAIVKFRSKLRQQADIVAMDCKRLFEPNDPMDFESEDWFEAVSFVGRDQIEDIVFERLDEMKNTSGFFYLYASVPVPDGREAIKLGWFDLLDHDETRLKLTRDSRNEIILTPYEETETCEN